MANPFEARAAKLAASIGRAFGETFTFLPFSTTGDVNLPKLPDLSRSQFDAVGIWDGPTKSTTPHARGSIQDDNAHNWATSAPSVLVADAALSWQPKRGDRVLRQSDRSVYEVSKPEPDGFGSTYFFLTDKKLTQQIVTPPSFVPSLDFSDPRNSQYLALFGPGGVPSTTTFAPSMNFSDPRNSQYLALVGPGAAVSGAASGKLDFSNSQNSGLIATIGA